MIRRVDVDAATDWEVTRKHILKMRRANAPEVAIGEATIRKNTIERVTRYLMGEAAKLAELLEFQERDPCTEYADTRRIYECEDGETHWVCAESMKGAERVAIRDGAGYGDFETYIDDFESPPEIKEIAPDMALRLDTDGKVVIKTAAEWAFDTHTDRLVGTTAL